MLPIEWRCPTDCLLDVFALAKEAEDADSDYQAHPIPEKVAVRREADGALALEPTR